MKIIMKKTLFILSAMAAVIFAASCDKKENQEVKPVEIKVQLTSGGSNFAVAGIKVSLSDAAASFTMEENTDASGAVNFTVKPGSYSAKASYTTSENGVRLAYSGQAAISVDAGSSAPFELSLQKVESQQIVIKEVYSTQCAKTTSGSYGDDAYIILYNNSDVEADATNVVIGMLFPYNAHANNKFYNESNALIYENDTWIPAASGLWSFTSEVKIPAYSQIVIALFGAINHTATAGLENSVDLSDASYYWMSKNEKFTAKKYAVADDIPQTHYLSCVPFNMGTAWLFSNTAPALFIGNMSKAEAEALATDTEGYDYTQGTGASNQAVKFPQVKVIGAVDVWASDKLETSKLRFPAKINAGYVAITGKLGHTIYRNVDKEATEALPENEGKLVYDYAGGTYDPETKTGTTDPSGIDAEASIAAGAHIIYKQTNSSADDFHERKVASIKK